MNIPVRGIQHAYIVAIRSIEVVRPVERDVGVGDDPCITQIVGTGGVRQQAVQKEDIALLCRHRRELFAVFDVAADSVRDGWVEAFRVIIQKFHESCAC